MTNPDDSEELCRWARIMNKSHGYGGVFNHETTEDKAIVEVSTANEWRRAVASEFGLAVGEPEQNPHDPPDCFVQFSGRRLSVELVQLINPNHKRRASNGESPYMQPLFEDMQWTKCRLISELNELIRNKGEKYQQPGIQIDVLLIHTAETWLRFDTAKEWLDTISIRPHRNIANAFLLFEYEPGRGTKCWPVSFLYGDLISEKNAG
ncbi:hypothetical protein [Ruegeria arenilitoris]|uniref:hypothetical protein n=1 Tax=Ruegeria arenilitoris TaxID=1173585 RepID=UPI00147B2B6C|nr:hypothetical protein [Ruegeria arenilitoris]